MTRAHVMAAASLLGITRVLTGAAGGWTPEPPLPQPLAGHAAAWHRDTCWIAGGSWWDGEQKRIGAAIFRRPAATMKWERAGDMADGFAHGGFAADARGLWLAGGLGERSVSDRVRRIDFATGRVTEIARLQEPRLYCGAAFLDNALWVLGGVAADGDFSLTSGAGWRFDATTGAVTALPPGPAWINPLVLALDGKLHVLPGGEWSAARGRLEPPEKVFVYSPAERRWETRPLPVRLPRGLSGAALDDRRALVCGGAEMRDGIAALARGAWLYDTTGGSLRAIAELPEPRLAAAVVSSAGEVLVLGGEDRPRGRADTVWRLRPESSR